MTCDLFIDNERLFEELCSIPRLTSGYNQVRKNKGAPGVDGVTIEMYSANLDKELSQLQQDLQSWTYKPKPVRAVEIDKPGSKDKRLLGIPCIRDRIVQAALKELLEPIFELTFSENSYGFRPGRSQHDAVKRAQEIVKEGKEYVVDIDLEKFFNRINHDKLIARLSNKIPDKRILRLIGMTLRSGVMQSGIVSSTEEGAVQGSPLSPLMSNIVLDELDKELESRGHSFCRFADDCNVFVRSYKAAERVMEHISQFIEKRLKLRVNREKSKVAKSKEVKFLGFTIVNNTIAIAKKSLDTAMEKVKTLIPRGTHLNIEKSMEQVNRWYTGWANYYGLGQYPAQLRKIEAHIRRRFRARIVKQHKRRRFLAKKLIKRGVKPKMAWSTLYSANKGTWRLSRTMALSKAYPNAWFIKEVKQVIKSTEKHGHWFDVNKWISLT